jgi:hypothetical protein
VRLEPRGAARVRCYVWHRLHNNVRISQRVCD